MWQELQNYASGLRDRMSGQAPPMSGFSQMGYRMPNNNPSLTDAFKRTKNLFNPQIMPNMPQKYMRSSMSPGVVNPPTVGAGSPTAYGDVRTALASPYSLQQTQSRVY